MFCCWISSVYFPVILIETAMMSHTDCAVLFTNHWSRARGKTIFIGTGLDQLILVYLNNSHVSNLFCVVLLDWNVGLVLWLAICITGLYFLVRINLPLFSTVVPAIIFMFLSYRSFVAITTLSTPTRPVDNVVIATKDL